MDNNYLGDLADIVNPTTTTTTTATTNTTTTSDLTLDWVFGSSSDTQFRDLYTLFSDPGQSLSNESVFCNADESMQVTAPAPSIQLNNSRVVQISPTDISSNCYSNSNNISVKLPMMVASRKVSNKTGFGFMSNEMINNIDNTNCTNSTAGFQIPSPRNSAIKRRKSQAKKVVCIPAPGGVANSRQTGEVVPSDLWAWRKYGQKPIKGSPFPRGYYRCSSSKGCTARKQVERSKTEENMLVITYTSEHNHPWPTQRNALAGSSRSQPPSTTNKLPQHDNVLHTPSTTSIISTTTTSSMKDGVEFNNDYSQSDQDFFKDFVEFEGGGDPSNLLFTQGAKVSDDPFSGFLDWSQDDNVGLTKLN